MSRKWTVEELVSNPMVQKFFQHEDVQKAIKNEDFEEVYLLASAYSCPCPGYLHRIFENAGINPLDYLTDYLPFRYFYEDPYIQSIKIPGRFKSVGEDCFAGAENLESIEFEEGFEYLTAPRIFQKCLNLKTLILPASIKTPISNGIFEFCLNLKEIYYRGDVMTARNNVFSRSNVLTGHITKIICIDGDLDVKDGHILR